MMVKQIYTYLNDNTMLNFVRYFVKYITKIYKMMKKILYND